MSELPDSVTNVSYAAHYQHDTIVGFIVLALDKTHSITIGVVTLLMSWFGVFALSLIAVNSRLQIANSVLDVTTTYSVTVVGFTLVSLTLIFADADPRRSFSMFNSLGTANGLPLLKKLVMHFLFPVAIIVSLLFASFLCRILVPVLATMAISESMKSSLWIIGLSMLSWLFLFSVIELLLNYWNIYQFTLLSFQSKSDLYEAQIVEHYSSNRSNIPLEDSSNADVILKHFDARTKNPQ